MQRLEFSAVPAVSSVDVTPVEQSSRLTIQPFPAYDYSWKSEKNSKYQSGTEDNLWWFGYRKYLKQQGVIRELKFTVTEALSYYNEG